MCIAQRECLESLCGSGAEVDLLAYPWGGAVELRGLRIFRSLGLPFVRDVPIGPSWVKLALAPAFALHAFWLCLNNRYDAVHACEESAIVACALKRVFGLKVLYDMDDVLSRRIERSGFCGSQALLRAASALERWSIRSCDAILTNSRDTTERASSLVHPGKVVFYHHLPPLPFERGDAPAAGCGKTVLYAGNLEPYQGVDLLLESLPAVFRSAPDARCVIVGGSSRQIAGLRGRAERLGIGAKVACLGSRPISETFRLMRESAVLVSPMTQEKAVPMKLYAYMAAGRPIVATALPNHTQLLDGESAVLVPPEPDALADAIARVLSSPELARRLSLGAGEALKRCAAPGAGQAALRDAYRLMGLGRDSERSAAGRGGARSGSPARRTARA